MCDDPKNLCCEAINRALGTFQLQLAEVVARGTTLSGNVSPAERGARTALVTAALRGIADQVRAALARLATLQCDSACCASAAFAIRDAAIGLAALAVEAAFNPNVPLTAAPTAPTFFLTAILASLVGSAAFPGFPTPIAGSLSEDINIILSTVVCPVNKEECIPCFNRIKCKPGRKQLKCTDDRY